MKPTEKSASFARRHSQNNSEEVAARLEAVAPDAVAVLHAALFDGSRSTRIRAALAILNIAIISTEIKALESHVSRLEQLKWKPQHR